MVNVGKYIIYINIPYMDPMGMCLFTCMICVHFLLVMNGLVALVVSPLSFSLIYVARIIVTT